MEDAEHDTQQKRVRLNIGGQVFETTLAVLTREPGSKLARVAERFVGEVDDALASARAAAEHSDATAAQNAPSAVSEVDALVPSLQLAGAGGSQGHLAAAANAVDPPFFDRDWWLFRYLLQALREGPAALPQDPALLKQLFDEAAYWRLGEMQEHMRTLYMRVAARQAESEASLANTSASGMPPASQSMGTQALLATAMSRAAANAAAQQPQLDSTWPGGAANGMQYANTQQHFQGQYNMGNTAPWQPVAAPAPGALRPGLGGPGVPAGGALPPTAQGGAHWNHSSSQPWPTSYGGTASSAAPASGLAAKAALVGFGGSGGASFGYGGPAASVGAQGQNPGGYPSYTLPTAASAYAASPSAGYAQQPTPFPTPAGGVAASAGLATAAGWPASSALAASYGMGASMAGYSRTAAGGVQPSAMLL